MNKEYKAYLESVKRRKYDEHSKLSGLSENFKNPKFPASIRYVAENFREPDLSFTNTLLSSFRSTQELLGQKLKALGHEIDFRYIGPHLSSTHIDLYSDLELLIIKKNVGEKPGPEIQRIALDIIQILTQAQAYNLIDFSSKHKIRVQLRKPICYVQIVPAIWVDNETYLKSKLEIHRGIADFNFEKKTKKVSHPFLNLARLNSRDQKSMGSLKSFIRLLYSLVYDSTLDIKLTHDELAGLVYNLPLRDISKPLEQRIGTLPYLLSFIDKVIKENDFREKLLMPSKKELVFQNSSEKLKSLTNLRNELKEVLDDIRESMASQKKKVQVSN